VQVSFLAPGDLALEKAGTGGKNCTGGFLCNNRNSDPLRSLHPGHKGDSCPHRPFLVFHLHHSSAMPVVGLKELHLDASELGYLFTAMATGSVTAAICIMPLARARLSPNRLTFYANVLLVLTLFLMAFVSWPRAFLLPVALGGAGWTLSATELWIAAQRAMPDWARGRLNATIVMCSQAATALGGVIWGSAAATAGVVPTFLGAGLLAIVTLAIVHFAVQKRLSIDFAADLNLEPAAVFHDLDPMRLSQAENLVSIVTEFAIDPRNRAQVHGSDARNSPRVSPQWRPQLAPL
jgi:hypothetical protein